MLPVARIHSAGRSGSTILGALLDCYDGVRHLGEIRRLADQSNPGCWQCDNDCRFYDGIDPKAVYTEAERLYPGTWLLVDSSKTPHYYDLLEAPGRSLSVLLTKTPHELAWSLRSARSQPMPVEKAFRHWIDTNRANLKYTRKNDRYFVTHREIVADPWGCCVALMGSMSHFVTERTVQHDTNWWFTDTHTLGGNWAVRTAVDPTKEDRLLVDRPHYRGRTRELFVDESWRHDNEFLAACWSAYYDLADELEPVLKKWRLGGVDTMVLELGGDAE